MAISGTPREVRTSRYVGVALNVFALAFELPLDPDADAKREDRDDDDDDVEAEDDIVACPIPRAAPEPRGGVRRGSNIVGVVSSSEVGTELESLDLLRAPGVGGGKT